MNIKQNKKNIIYWWQETMKLVFIKQKATPEFWDRQWQRDDWEKAITSSRNCRYWFKILKKYLPDKNSRVLEGGCGYGHLVDAMEYWGYKSSGIDFALKTITKIKEVMPNLDVRYGNVNNLYNITSEYFDGYFSIGVIEHFWEGYHNILKEMYRVLKLGGYVFITFPCVSLLDKINAFFCFIKKFTETEMPLNFYQFSLEWTQVKYDFEVLGFKLIRKQKRYGLLGLSKYFTWIQQLHDYLVTGSKKNSLIKYVFFCLNYILTPICNHSILLILRKN